jgi:hypothetical protein
MKRLVIVTIGIMLMGTQALAFDLMGPTTSRLKDSGKTSIGAELELGRNVVVSFEVQATSGSSGMGGQLVWKF